MSRVKLFGKWLLLLGGQLIRLLLEFPLCNLIIIPILVLQSIEYRIYKIRGMEYPYPYDWKGVWAEYIDFFFDSDYPIFDWVAILNPSEYFRETMTRAERIRIHKCGDLSWYQVWTRHRRPLILKKYKERLGIMSTTASRNER